RAALSSRGRAHRCSWRRRRGPRRVSGPEVVADAWISLFPGWCRSMSTVSAIWRVALEARSELGLLGVGPRSEAHTRGEAAQRKLLHPLRAGLSPERVTGSRQRLRCATRPRESPADGARPGPHRRSEQAARDRPAGQLVAGRELELAQHRGDVGLDRLDRDEQLARDLAVGVPAGDEAHDLLLAL